MCSCVIGMRNGVYMNNNASTISKRAVGMHWREHCIHDAYTRRALQLYTITSVINSLPLGGDTCCVKA
jgi:hypothetical protein